MKYILLFLSIFIAFTSCTKEVGVAGPTGPQGTAGVDGTGAATDTGTITGRLTMYDEFSYSVGSNAGVIVTLTAGSLRKTDTTDAKGTYAFPGIKTGTYDLTYEKSGFGTMKMLSISHFGGGAAPTLIKDVILIQVPVSTAPDSLGLSANNGSYTNFLIRLDTSSLAYVEYYQNIALFCSKDKNVSAYNYQYKNTFSYPDGQGGYVESFTKNDISNPLPFNYGDTVYAVFYTYNSYVNLTSNVNSTIKYITDGGTYTDPQTGATILPNLSRPSNVLKFVY